MLAFLWSLIVTGQFCQHRWEPQSHCALVDENGDKIGMKYHLRCTKCGDMKAREL